MVAGKATVVLTVFFLNYYRSKQFIKFNLYIAAEFTWKEKYLPVS